jgi:hypothetical protein
MRGKPLLSLSASVALALLGCSGNGKTTLRDAAGDASDGNGAAGAGGSTASGSTGGANATGGTMGDAGVGGTATAGNKATGGSATGGRVAGDAGNGGSAMGGAGTGGAAGGGGKATGGVPSGGSTGAATGGTARGGSTAGAGGTTSTGGTGTTPACTLPPPSSFKLNTTVGGGGSSYKESDHFAVFDASSADAVLNLLESAHQCFVEEWCWRSPGLSITSSSETYNKFNLYAVSTLANNAAGVMQYDKNAGLAYLQVLPAYLTTPTVTVHEYGHALTLAAKSWVDQTRTGYWWEAMANFVADTFVTSSFCANARSEHNIAQGNTIMELDTLIGNSFWTICMNQNYYQAWPFFAYLTYNPDNYPGLGQQAIPDLWRTYKSNNETPLHTLERMIAPVTVPTLVGRYWARMAYVDIGHPQGQKTFNSAKNRLTFANLTASGTAGTYTVVAARQPRYFGASIIPLKVSGSEVSAQVTIIGGTADGGVTATLSIRAGTTVRYVDLPNGTGSATIASGEEVTLVVANTPKSLILYDPSTIGATTSSDPANTGLNYQVQLTGATPAN